MLHKNILRKISCLLIALSFVMLYIPVYAESEPEIIRVGYVANGSIFTFDEEGNVKGYETVLLDEIAKQNNWQYEYVGGTLDQIMDMLDKGQVDLLCHVKKNADREQKYLFSDFVAGIETGALCCRAEDDRFFYNDFSSFEGMRVAMLKGNYFNTKLAEYAEKSGFSYIPCEYDSYTECYDALKKGAADGIVIGSLVVDPDCRILSCFCSEPFYFITGKQNEEFMRRLDSTVSEMLSCNPNYIFEAFSKYYNDNTPSETISLTKAEAEFVEQCGEIVVGQMPTRYPLSSLNSETGLLEGINEDILAEISKISGLKFKNIALEVGETTPEALKSGRLDFVMGIMDNQNFRSNPDYAVTDSFLSSAVSVITKKGEEFSFDKPYRIGMKRAFLALRNYVEEKYPNFTVTVYDTDEDCLKALIEGKEDIAMQNVYVANYTMQKPQYANLQMIPAEFLTENSAMIANSDIDPRAISIINKAIQALDSEKINQIVLSHTGASPYIMTAEDIIYAYRYIIAIVLLVIVLLAGMVIIIAVNKHRNVKILTEKNNQLKDALLHAEDASKAKSSFLSKMSHEIRTPINAIAGFSAIARKHENDSEKVDDCLKKIDSSTKALLDIVNDVLDMNSIENNRMKIDSAEFDLTRVIEEIRDIYEPQCNAKNVQFTVSADIPDELLTGDSLRVEQILLNLVSNAYKFTPSGGSIDFTVSETNRSGNDAYLRFVVADTGCGMSDDMLGRVFKPFEQETSDSAKKHTGSGLGLSIAKNLVDMMQGAISVRSQKGKGTTFTVDLPFGLTGKTGGEKNTINSPAANEKQYDFTGYKVILAEDNEFNAEIARDLLGLVNMAVDTAENGVEAVKLFESNPPHTYCCVLMDLRMPEMDGLEAARKIRSLDREDAGEIPIYAMTANTYAEDITASLSAGMNGHLAKPIDVDMLYRTLEKAVKGAARHL